MTLRVFQFFSLWKAKEKAYELLDFPATILFTVIVIRSESSHDLAIRAGVINLGVPPIQVASTRASTAAYRATVSAGEIPHSVFLAVIVLTFNPVHVLAWK